MASEKVLDVKREVVKEISNNFDKSAAFVLVDYRGLTVDEMTELRRTLRASDADIKIYKNTLTKRALNDRKVSDLDEYLEGPSAVAFSTDALAPVKILHDFAKKHKALEFKVGIIDGIVSDKAALMELAKIPSREGLLTMLAGGMLGVVRELSMALNMLSEQKEN
ncbi:MAG: 50S ribosomal protein L10 [Bacilli bacterium]|nr:50S ribosomal protein L10 [Bacilli bacterium]